MIALTCSECGRDYDGWPYELRRSKTGRVFCSRACRYAGALGSANPNWRGGKRIDKDGYVLIHAPQHPHHRQGYVLEHRLVIEQAISRHLEPSEVVHHINGVKDDNRIENLELLADGSAHRRRHGDWQPRPCDECGTPVLRTIGQRNRWRRSFCGRKCAALAASKVAAVKNRKRAS